MKVLQEKYPQQTAQARRDHAHVTKQELVEPPYWFSDGKTEFLGIYGCIGWPQPTVESGNQAPGYGAVVGVVRSAKPAADSDFRLLAEVQSPSALALLQGCDLIRKEWGYGVHPDIVPVFYGDYRNYENVLADFNAHVIKDAERAISVSPPPDFDNPLAFELYLGSLRGALSEGAKRLYFGNLGTIRGRFSRFTRGDPAFLALGGLVHFLVLHAPWMERMSPSVIEVFW